MKEFKNVPSKLYEKTNDWITKEKNLTKTKYKYPETKPKPRRIMSASHPRRVMVGSQPSIPISGYQNLKNFELYNNQYNDINNNE